MYNLKKQLCLLSALLLFSFAQQDYLIRVKLNDELLVNHNTFNFGTAQIRLRTIFLGFF